MNYKSTVLIVTTLIGLLSPVNSAFAAAPPYSVRQKNLNQAKDTLIVLSSTVHQILPQGALLQLESDEVANAARDWVASWEQVRDLMGGLDTEGRANLEDSAALLAKVSGKILETKGKTDALGTRAKSLRFRTQKLSEQIRRNPAPAAPVPEYRDALAGLQERLNTILTNLEVISDRVAFIDSSIGSVQVALAPWCENRIKLSMIRGGITAIDRVMGEVSAYFAAEAAIDPIVASVRKSYSAYSGHFTAMRVFHARKARENLDLVAASALNQLASLDVDASYRTDAAAKITRWQTIAKQQLDQQAAQFSNAILVGSYISRRSRILQPRCTAADPGLDCSLLKKLSTIPSAKISAMDDAWLSLLEFSWDQVEMPQSQQSELNTVALSGDL